jgi:hypothetical protein
VPPRNPHFQGRQGLLDDLAERLGGSATTALTQAVSGLGGIGKTQTAIEYCHRNGDRYRYVVWATAQSPEVLTARYAELARQAGLATAATPADQAATAFLAWLAAERSWLLVLDNVEERPQELPLPQGREGHVLITTRLRLLPPVLGAGEPFRGRGSADRGGDGVPARTGRQARRGRRGEGGGRRAGPRARRPAARPRAGRRLHRRAPAPLRAYLDLLRRQRQVLALEEGSWGIAGGYEKDVASTWLLNMEQLPAAAREAMNACAYLAPERIPLSLLVEHGHLLGPALSALAEELRSDPAAAHRHLVRPLTRFSLFRFDPERQELSLHRMVQWVARQRLEARARRSACSSRRMRWSRPPSPRTVDPPRTGLSATDSSRTSWRSSRTGRCHPMLRRVRSDAPLGSRQVSTPGRPDEAGKHLELDEVVEVRRRVFGEEHPRR